MLDLEVLLKHWAWILAFNIGFILLLLTPFGASEGGNRAWLRFPFLPVSIGPAEVVKISFVLLLAYQLQWLREEKRDLRSFPSAMMVAGHALGMCGLYFVVSGDMGLVVMSTLPIFSPGATGVIIPCVLSSEDITSSLPVIIGVTTCDVPGTSPDCISPCCKSPILSPGNTSSYGASNLFSATLSVKLRILILLFPTLNGISSLTSTNAQSPYCRRKLILPFSKYLSATIIIIKTLEVIIHSLILTFPFSFLKNHVKLIYFLF